MSEMAQNQLELELAFFNQKMHPLFVFKLNCFSQSINGFKQLKNQKEGSITIKQMLSHLLKNGLFELIQKSQAKIGSVQQIELQHIRFEVSINQNLKNNQQEIKGKFVTKKKILQLNDNIDSIRKICNIGQQIIQLQIKIQVRSQLQQQTKIYQDLKEENLQKMEANQKMVSSQIKSQNIVQKQEGCQLQVNKKQIIEDQQIQGQNEQKQQKSLKQSYSQQLQQEKNKISLNFICKQNKQSKQDNNKIEQGYIDIQSTRNQLNLNNNSNIKLSNAKLRQFMLSAYQKQESGHKQNQQWHKQNQQWHQSQEEFPNQPKIQMCKVIFYQIVDDNNQKEQSNLIQLEVCHIKKMTILKNKILINYDVFFDKKTQNPVNRVNIILKDTNLYCRKNKKQNKNTHIKFNSNINFIQNQENRNKFNDNHLLQLQNKNQQNTQNKGEINQQLKNYSMEVVQSEKTDKIEPNQNDVIRILKFRERNMLKSSSLNKFKKLGRFKSQQASSQNLQELLEIQTFNTMEQFTQCISTELQNHQHRSQKIIKNQNFVIKCQKNNFSLKNSVSSKKSPQSPLKRYKNEQIQQKRQKNQVYCQKLLVQKLMTEKSQQEHFQKFSNKLTPKLTKIQSQFIRSQNKIKKQQNKQSIFKIKKKTSLFNNVLKIIEEETKKKNIVRQNLDHLSRRSMIKNQDKQYLLKNIQQKQENNIKRIKNIFNAYCNPLSLHKSKSQQN